MEGIFSRTELLLGEAALVRLQSASVAVFGLGGVGAYSAEALVRSGIGTLLLVDMDTVAQSNINRQLVALHSTIGKKKVDVMCKRALDINPNIIIKAYDVFYNEDTAEEIDLSGVDYIVDAIDTVSSKILLIERAFARGIPIISSMGTGNKLDATRFEVADIYETSVCPLARVMRKELRARGITSLMVVYSREEPLSRGMTDEANLPQDKRQIPGSVAFVPSVAGLILAGEVVKYLL